MEAVNRRVVVIALIMALMTSFLIYIYIKKETDRPAAVEKTISIYVAARTLPPRHKIMEGDLKLEEINERYVNTGSLHTKSEILGKRTKESIFAGEQILKERLADDSKASLAYSIPEGKRAVSINVNEQLEVANLIRPGDFVDIIANFEKEEYEDKVSKVVLPKTTKMVIQNVQILALGQETWIPEEKGKELPKTITLAVSPEDAEKLVYITEYGAIRLALRPVGDDKQVETEGVVRSDFVTDKGVRVLPK